MKIVKIEEVDVEEVVRALERGGLVVFPTETMYGAGVDATNPKAVEKLLKYKKRPTGKPLSIAVKDTEMARKYVTLNKTAENIYQSMLPGPVTVVSKINRAGDGGKLAAGVASELGSVGVRISDYPLVRQIVEKLGRPMTATSANASYKKRPYKISDVWDNLSDKQKDLVEIIIDAGELPHREPSTVVDTTADDAVVLRQGEIQMGGEKQVTTFSEEQTQNVGKELVHKYSEYLGNRAVVLGLVGPMGVGKTQLTKGVAKAVGVTEEVASPTYNLEVEYADKLVHIDAWRLTEKEEGAGLGIRERIEQRRLMVVEWADKIAEELRKFDEEAVVVWVKMEYGRGERERKISWGVEK